MNLLIWLIMVGYIIGFFIGVFYWKKDKEKHGYHTDTVFNALCTIIYIPFISILILFLLWVLIATKIILYVILFDILMSVVGAILYWNESEIKEFLNKGEDE